MKHSLGCDTLGHKTSLSKFQKVEVISHVFSDKSVKLEINCKKKKMIKPQKHD